MSSRVPALLAAPARRAALLPGLIALATAVACGATEEAARAPAAPVAVGPSAGSSGGSSGGSSSGSGSQTITFSGTGASGGTSVATSGSSGGHVTITTTTMTRSPGSDWTTTVSSSGEVVPVRRLLEAHMDFLASDDLGGRETGTLQSLITCRYVASAFRQAGLVPGGTDGGWFQLYPLEAQRVGLESARLTLSVEGEPSEPRLLQDWVVSGYGGEGLDLHADAVYAGYGLLSDRAGVDDYAGVDPKGRFAVVVYGRPADRDDLRLAGNWRAKRAAARDRGAVGMLQLVLSDDAGAQNAIEFARHRLESPSMSVPSEERPDAWPMITLWGEPAHALARALGVEGEDGALDLTARALPDLGVAIAADVVTERIEARNVLGVIPGTDPALKDEYVIVSAHNDHVGILPDGRVNNGADDNASGTSTIMTAAAVLAAGPPMRRSVLFLSVSGEEKGLLGSEWWVAHPTVPIDRVVANVNIDMVGRNDPDAVGATPSPEHEHYNTLVARAKELAPSAGLELSWTAPKDGTDRVDNYYARSDHYNFAEAGIPVVFFFSGVHEDYHRPTDDLDRIDMGKLERMVDLVSRLVRDTADADGRPHGLQSEGG